MQQTPRRVTHALILLLGLVWIFLSTDKTGRATSGNIPAPQQGFQAPDFELITTTGEIIKLSDLQGQAVLVNLWATWCPPCRAEMRTIERIYLDYEEQGLVVLAVNMTYQDNEKQINPFIAEQGLTYPILLDKTGQMANAYQLKSLASSYFIDRAGLIREVVIGGPMAEALLRTRVEEILK